MTLQREDFLRAAEALQQDPMQLPPLVEGAEEAYLQAAVPIVTARFIGGIMTRAEQFEQSASLLAETDPVDLTAFNIKRLALLRVSEAVQFLGFQTYGPAQKRLQFGYAYQQLVVFWGDGKALWETPRGRWELSLKHSRDKANVLENSVVF